MKITEILANNPYKSGCISLNLEIYQENSDSFMFICEESGSGATYKVTDTKNIADIIKDYLDNRHI